MHFTCMAKVKICIYDIKKNAILVLNINTLCFILILNFQNVKLIPTSFFFAFIAISSRLIN